MFSVSVKISSIDLSWKLSSHFAFYFFYFFSLCVNSKITWFYFVRKNTIYVLFIYCSCTVYGSHNTIHTFKNYFAIVFSIFNFSNNKFNLNGSLVYTISIIPSLIFFVFVFCFWVFSLLLIEWEIRVITSKIQEYGLKKRVII